MDSVIGYLSRGFCYWISIARILLYDIYRVDSVIENFSRGVCYGIVSHDFLNLVCLECIPLLGILRIDYVI